MSRNIRTFRDLGADDHQSDSDDSGAEAGRGAPQEFYAGSGQAVQGPRGARNPDSEAHIRRILQAAEVVGPEEASHGRPSDRPEDLVTLTLHLWVDGLSIDDGPLMSRQDPATIAFLEEVGRGDIPSSIGRKYPGKKIDFKIERHREEYVVPKMKPFGGNGVRLGNVVPNVVGETSSSIANPIVVEDTSAAELAKQLEDAKKELNTDMAQPTTNIQVRLPNNQRLVGVFNHTHTLSALRLFICTSRPELIYQPFQLMSAYPPKVFEDETQTLKDANCLNSVITIKVTPAN